MHITYHTVISRYACRMRCVISNQVQLAQNTSGVPLFNALVLGILCEYHLSINKQSIDCEAQLSWQHSCKRSLK